MQKLRALISVPDFFNNDTIKQTSCQLTTLLLILVQCAVLAGVGSVCGAHLQCWWGCVVLVGPVFGVGGGCTVPAKYITISKCPLLELGTVADAGDGLHCCCASSLVLHIVLQVGSSLHTGFPCTLENLENEKINFQAWKSPRKKESMEMSWKNP